MKILIILATLLFSFSQSDAACRGRNLYDSAGADFLKSVDRKVAKIPYSSGLYWEVSKGGKTSWIIGTIHYKDNRVSKIPAFFQKKIKKARLLQVEVTEKQIKDTFMMLIKEVIKRGPNKKKKVNWWAKLTPQEQAILTKEARSKRVSPKKLRTMTVGGMASLIRHPKCALRGSDHLDLRIKKLAARSRVPQMGLDNSKDLIADILKKRGNDADSFFVMREELKRLSLRDDFAETMVQMYKRGEIEKYLTFSFAASRAYYPKRYHRALEKYLRNDLLDGRNKAWIKNIAAQMKNGNVVTAVGAGHLPGTQGVLNLLKKKGFTIKRLNL